MLPLIQLKVESPDGHKEPSPSFIPGFDNGPSLSEISHNITRPLSSESTTFERIFKHDSNKNSVAGLLEYENVTDIPNSTFNNVSHRMEKPDLLEDHGIPVVDDESELEDEVDSRIPVGSHSSATGEIYNPETESAQAFSSVAIWSDKISVTSESDDISKGISVTTETNSLPVPEITVPLNKNITFAPISDVTKESNSFGLVRKGTIKLSNLGYLPAATEDYPEFSFAVGNKKNYVPVTEERVETSLPVILNMKYVASSTEEHTGNVAVIIENIEPAVAVTFENTGTVVPVTELNTGTVVPVTELNTETVVPVTELNIETVVPVTEEITEIVIPAIEEITYPVVPISELNTETFVPVMEDVTETFVPVMEENSGTVATVTEVKTYTTVHVRDENINIYVPINDEKRGILELAGEETTKAAIPVTLENTEIYESRSKEHTEIYESSTEEHTEIYESSTEEHTEIYESSTEEHTEIYESSTEENMETGNPAIERILHFGTVKFTGFVDEESWKDAAVLGIGETTQTDQITTDDIMDEVSSDVPDNLEIAGINSRIQANSSTHESKLAVNSTDASEHDVILEASLRTEVFQSTFSAPLEPATIDVQIKTIKDLQVDAHDILFDPSQIAKATSYEESSYSTATRSATVTTWVDPNNRNVIGQGYTNSSQLRGLSINSKNDAPLAQETKSVIPGFHIVSEHHTNLEITTISPFATSDSSNQLLGMEVTAVPGGYTYNDFEKNYSRQEDINFVHKTVTDSINSNIGEHGTSEIPILKLNDGDIGNVSGTNLHSAESNAGNNFVYEMPVLNRNPGLHLTSSIVIALSICCSVVVILSILTVSLWLRRRHKNRSKIYLSQESVKPKAFFTKPMHPALLPDERLDVPESSYMIEFQKPRAPVVLSDDPDHVKRVGETVLESQTDGIENHAFVDIPLEDLKPKNFANGHITQSQNPPKFGSKSLPESNSDSGIKVWSSTGSLYRASPDFCHCPVPPPPYLSSSGDDLVNISVDALSSLGGKSRLLYV